MYSLYVLRACQINIQFIVRTFSLNGTNNGDSTHGRYYIQTHSHREIEKENQKKYWQNVKEKKIIKTIV